MCIQFVPLYFCPSLPTLPNLREEFLCKRKYSESFSFTALAFLLAKCAGAFILQLVAGEECKRWHSQRTVNAFECVLFYMHWVDCAVERNQCWGLKKARRSGLEGGDRQKKEKEERKVDTWSPGQMPWNTVLVCRALCDTQPDLQAGFLFCNLKEVVRTVAKWLVQGHRFIKWHLCRPVICVLCAHHLPSGRSCRCGRFWLWMTWLSVG